MVDSGMKRGFTSADVFYGLGYNFSQAVPGNLSQYPTGENIDSAEKPHPQGALVSIGPAIYKVTSSGRVGIPNAKVFNSWKWSWDKVVPVNVADSGLPAQENLKFRDGTLLKSESGAIYIVSDTKLLPFPSMDRFNGFGYRLSQVIDVSNSEIGGYATGETL